MADRGSYGLGPRLDLKQLFFEAQHRWLRPAEICEILCNYQKFQISSEPPNRPPSGSLFLFDRKVLRYFRKDGHNWRKKKDGKTVKEAHEKLKVGSVDVLHCYYAHGEDNENFQRRSYWMLEQELMHIVFVHYLEVKGSRTSSSPSTSFTANHYKEPSGVTDSTSPTSSLTSQCEDADSADSYHANSRYQLFPKSSKLQSATLADKTKTGPLNSHFLHAGSDNVQDVVPGSPISYVHRDSPDISSNSNHIMETQSLPSWEEVFEQCTTAYNGVPPLESTSTQSVAIANEGNVNLGESLGGGSLPIQSNWQIPFGNSSLQLQGGNMDPTATLEWTYDLDGRFYEQGTSHDVNQKSSIEPYFPVPQNEPLQNSHQVLLTGPEPPHLLHSNLENEMLAGGNSKHPFFVKQSLVDGEEGLKKVDSFSRWITRELGEVDDLNMRSSSGLSWTTVECGNVVDDPSLSPSLSQDQLFSIIDFSPKWAYADSETEVHIVGKFLRSGLEVAKYNWSCMFGELEVPADILEDGILCCYAPPHSVARVPFYVTCSNRLACSEVREFDYCDGSVEDLDIKKFYDGNADEAHIFMRLDMLLSFRSPRSPDHRFDDSQEKQKLINKLILLKEDESYQTRETIVDGHLPPKEAKERLFERQMKDKLFSWLLHRITDGGKGPSMLDDNGQGVLHLTAALGFDWAIEPIVTAGVSIDFRDVNGWTALHWAAFYGREEMVAVLVSLGAATGALTHPSSEFPKCRTPADLASANGHKGISGYLAESSLTSYLSSLTVKDLAEASGKQVVQTISARTATPVSDGDVPDALSMKDSLTAISNATQAADRIHQVFRMQSFHRKMLNMADDDGILDQHALSVAVGKARKSAQHDGVAHAAAIQIQKKFRGWKRRKEFLIIRQRIVKIQAHVRGHQVRKKYKTIVWSVGILEKVILRWRRKGSGLRGFRRDAPAQVCDVETMPSEEDDYDFLKEGRKQNEERQQKALSRVKSMFYDAEGRAQYRRLLTAVEKLRDAKGCTMDLSNLEEGSEMDNELIEIDSLLDDESFMSIAFEGSEV